MTRERSINVYKGLFGWWWVEEVGTNGFVCERHGPLTEENARDRAVEIGERDPLPDQNSTMRILPFAADGRYMKPLPRGRGKDLE